MKDFEYIWRYLRGERKGKAANRLEREALCDPFLYEALEGLEGVEADHEGVVKELQVSLQAGTGERRRWKVVIRLLAAASVLLLGGVAVWVLTGREAEESEHVAVVAQMPGADSTVPGMPVVAAAVVPDSEAIAEQTTDRRGEVAVTGFADKKRKKGGGVERAATDEAVLAEVDEAVADETVVEADTVKVADSVEDKLGKRLNRVEVRPAASKAKSGIRIRGISPRNQQPPREEVAEQQKEEVISYDKGRKRNRKPKSVASLATDWNKKSEGHLTWRQRFGRYVSDSLRYPETARANGVEGEVKLSVRLNKRGKPSRIRVMQKLTPECDREAVRLVEFYPGVLGDGSAGIIDLTIPFRLKETR